jgi:DNA recombination protein RmuC
MESLALLLGGMLLVVIAGAAYILGRQSAADVTPAITAGLERGTFAADIARLEERERTLTADIARQAGEIQRFSDALLISQRDHGASRERLAVAEERTAGLQRTLSAERESNETARRTLSAELEAAMEARDRMQASLAEALQRLAAAGERAAGLQRTQSADRDSNDTARRTLSAELEAAMEARDRLQAALTGISQKLAAADEREAGLRRTLTAERESNVNARRALSAELEAVTEARDRLQVSLAEASQKLAAASQMERELRDRIGRAEGHLADRDQRTADVEQQVETLRMQLAAKDRDLATSLEREFALVKDLAERDKKQLEGLRERLAAEFETIANRLLATTANQLSARSQESLSTALDPLSARIVDFQHKVQAARLDSRQGESARAIAEQAKQLYDTLAAAVVDLNDVSLKLQAVAEAHTDAMEKLSTGKGNALSRAEKLKSLGTVSRTEMRVIPFNPESHVEDDDADAPSSESRVDSA